MQNVLFLILFVGALQGCTSLKTISTLPPVYEQTTLGAYDDYPYCVVDILENHDRFAMTALRYDIRVNTRQQATTIHSAVKSNQDFGVFIMEIDQVTGDQIHIKLRGKKATQLEIRETIIAADRCLNRRV